MRQEPITKFTPTLWLNVAYGFNGRAVSKYRESWYRKGFEQSSLTIYDRPHFIEKMGLAHYEDEQLFSHALPV